MLFAWRGRRNLGGWLLAVNARDDVSLKVIRVRGNHPDSHELADVALTPHLDRPVDLGRLRGRPTGEHARLDLVLEQNLDLATDLRARQAGRDTRLRLHYALEPGLLHSLGQMPGQGRGVRVLLTGVAEHPGPLE